MLNKSTDDFYTYNSTNSDKYDDQEDLANNPFYDGDEYESDELDKEDNCNCSDPNCQV